MKRTITFLLFFALLFGIFACASPKDTDSQSAAETADPSGSAVPAVTQEPKTYFTEDFDNRFGRGYESIVETGEAYYYCSFSGKYLYYYDKLSDIYGVLCPKPECIHDEAESANKSCSGFVGSHARSLFASGGKLFYAASVRTSDYQGPALFGMKADGTEREMALELDFGETQNVSWPQRFDLHRGKLYGFIDYEKVEAGEPILYFSIVSLDPASGDYRTIFEKTDCRTTIFPKLFYSGNYLYFTVPDAGPRINTDTLEIFRWDIEKEELEKLFSSGEEGMPGCMFDLWAEEDGSIYVSPAIPEEGANPAVYLVSDGEYQKVFEFDENGSAYMIGGGAVCVTYPGFDLIVTDRVGNVLRRIKRDTSFLDGIGYSVDASNLRLGIYGDINELLVVYKSLRFEHEDGRKSSGTCLVRYDLTEDEPQAQLLAVSPWD